MINMFGKQVRFTKKMKRAVEFQARHTGLSLKTVAWLASIVKHEEFYHALKRVGCTWDGEDWCLPKNDQAPTPAGEAE